jgi:hypothetical protein
MVSLLSAGWGRPSDSSVQFFARIVLVIAEFVAAVAVEALTENDVVDVAAAIALATAVRTVVAHVDYSRIRWLMDS